MYRFENLTISYNPSCPSSTSGLVVGGYEYDATDAPPTTKQQLSGMEGAARNSVWTKGGWPCSPLPGWYYANPSGTAGDTRLNDVARFFYGVFAGTTNQPVGELAITYTVVFAKPEFSVYNASEYLQFQNSTLLNPAGTSTTVNGDDIFAASSGGSGIINLTAKIGGDFALTLLSVIASGATQVNNAIKSAAQLRAGITIATTFSNEATASFVSGASYPALNLINVSIRIGDVLMLTAANGLTAWQLVSLRVGRYRVTNG